MAINELTDLFKTDFTTKKENHTAKYCSKDSSGESNSFMKVFEKANKSYGADDPSSAYASNPNYLPALHDEKPDETRQKTDEVKLKETENKNQQTEETKPTEETKITSQADNQKQQTEESKSTETPQPTNKQDPSLPKTESAVDTAEKLLLEKCLIAATPESNPLLPVKDVAVPATNQDIPKEVKTETKPTDIPASTDNLAPTKAKPAITELKDALLPKETDTDLKLAEEPKKNTEKADIIPKIAEQKDSDSKKTEDTDKIKIDNKNLEKPDVLELLKNNSDKDKLSVNQKPSSPKIEEIKLSTASGEQKQSNDLNMQNNQNQQKLPQELKANLTINQTESTVESTPKVDLAKTAQFDKVFDSKMPDSIKESVLNQIKNATAQIKANDKTEITIALKPENLGRVNLNISSEKGVLTAEISAENNNVKDMLTKEMETLKQNLSDQGINVGKIAITVQKSAGSENNQDFGQAMHKFGQHGNSSGTDTPSNRHDNLSNPENQPELPTYDFEEATDEESDSNISKNPLGKVDYKV